MPTTNKSGRQTLQGKDGVMLERRYVYMQPETWAALHKLVQTTQLNQSTILETLISNAGKEITNDVTIS
ncbi:hypothetical protein [Cupriavidus sp. D39]|uniref:hypothetical protein n=1 Tax=Cupriavidus sp. D39 TaxID=2997877 RepID=UPI002271B381|nr:hypothetical protein [Cupriavidus sp. D39]MCY0855744.1 hypothetical protein [Cupriavidus sp. D39]